MILDENVLFSDKQAITTNCASTNVVYFGKREMAFGTPIDLFIQISETFNNLTSLSVKVQTSEDESFTTPITLKSQSFLLAELKKGVESNIRFIPKGNLGYMRLYYSIAGSTPTAGTITAGIVDGRQEGYHSII